MKNIIKKVLIGEAKKRAAKTQPNRKLNTIKDEISNYEKEVKNGYSFLGGPVAYFVIDAGNPDYRDLHGNERWDNTYRDDNLKVIEDFIKKSPYAIHVVVKTDPNFYLGLYRRDAFWVGLNMESIVNNMAFAIDGLQGEPVEYTVYRNGEVIRTGKGIPM